MTATRTVRQFGAVPTLVMVLVFGVVSLAAGILPVGAGRSAGAAVRPRTYLGGGVIGFGDAQTVNAPLASPLSSVMVTMAVDPAATPAAEGYWLASADGGVFAEGSAPFLGSLGSLHLQGPIVSMAPTPDGRATG